MKAITVRQPWAWAIIYGGKNVENRVQGWMWRNAVGERVAIHAAQRWSEEGASSPVLLDAFRAANDLAGMEINLAPYMFAPGAIVGTVEVVDLHEDIGCCAPWGARSYISVDGDGFQRTMTVSHLVLADPQPAPFMTVRGKLGLWTLPDDVAAAIAS